MGLEVIKLSTMKKEMYLILSVIILIISCKKKTTTTTTPVTYPNNKIYENSVFVSQAFHNDTVKATYVSSISSNSDDNSNEYTVSNFYYTVIHGNNTANIYSYPQNSNLSFHSFESNTYVGNQGNGLILDNNNGSLHIYSGDGGVGSTYIASISNLSTAGSNCMQGQCSINVLVKRIK